MNLLPGISQGPTGLGQPNGVCPHLDQVSTGEPYELQVSEHGSYCDRDVPNHADLADAVRQLQLYGPGLEKKGLNSKAERRDGVVHPSLLTVPPEIISKIFIHCLPQADGHDWLSPVIAPLLLTHISQRLREIAFATCQLWSSLRIDFRNPNVSVDAHSFLHSWLGRAKGQPLSLTYYSDFVSPRFSPFSPVIYPLIITYSHRLRSLKLVLNATDMPQFKSIRVFFPILRHLEIQGDFTSHADSEGLNVGSELRISNVDIYPSLTTLHITDISIPEFYRVLASCSHLVHFHTLLNGGMSDDPMPITSPRLESLSLLLRRTHERVLTSLTFPNLRSLSLYGPAALTSENFRPFISRSSRCLESLRLIVHTWTPEQMKELLKYRNSGPLLKCLISPTILPHLKALSITSTPLDYRMIISLIKLRQNAGIRLASFQWIDCYLDEGASEAQILKVANQYQELTTLGFKRSFVSAGIMAAVHGSAGEEYRSEFSWYTQLDL
ncbi:hypothetical protein C8J57DRAFT_1724381 [Mycena rebaudengoi]|nr:hypothetical protein C8J57DRAFT_1724381 [Mycena rebaudengoi]